MKTSEIIRKAIARGGKSRNQISLDTGVDPTTLHRIVRGGDMKTETADKLLEYFGYRVVKKKSRIAKRKK
ncbi:MAG: helix-turn-helix transcriptional regulator [Planctomycetes bacterium]|nr:helix-turn-helix transcriptional regulator [Planctomycetota bacterium]